jgi:hypothetical protein
VLSRHHRRSRRQRARAFDGVLDLGKPSFQKDNLILGPSRAAASTSCVSLRRPLTAAEERRLFSDDSSLPKDSSDGFKATVSPDRGPDPTNSRWGWWLLLALGVITSLRVATVALGPPSSTLSSERKESKCNPGPRGPHLRIAGPAAARRAPTPPKVCEDVEPSNTHLRGSNLPMVTR